VVILARLLGFCVTFLGHILRQILLSNIVLTSEQMNFDKFTISID